ncbi:uncharacterized protein K441DRAFT_353861 [Cenococcum geophilum 1.58]|uniref:Uncharacterized protein n=1 Tax=Cenococcum geophilum 1.58 TaxID=794803 RepID=A0ACC8EN31_9PEZI|nr:hypothetical protein K441DRAFT_353861 [Cenococcum geophilum 1.58]
MFTNIVALLRATDNDIHFNLGRNLLYHLVTGETVCYTKRLGGHWALMHREPTNSLKSTKLVFSTFKRYQPTSAPDPPISALVATTATSPNTISISSPKLLNVSQPAARARTC